MLPLISLAFVLGLPIAENGPRGVDHAAARLHAMRDMADGITMEQIVSGERLRLRRLPEPIYRFDHPERYVSDGTVWVWCRSGRPAALVTLTKHQPPDRDLHWLTELTSLAPDPISADLESFGTWRPSGAGMVVKKFPNAPPPAEDATERLTQMNELVLQIKAHENAKPRGRKYELSALLQPVYRYSEAKSGLIDGGMFFLAYRSNPEIAVLIEARRGGSSGPEWVCGFAPIAQADLHVEVDNKEIWSRRSGRTEGRADVYWLFMRPIETE